MTGSSDARSKHRGRTSACRAMTAMAALLVAVAGPALAGSIHVVKVIERPHPVGDDFDPEDLVVQAGDTVRFSNDSHSTHFVASDDDSWGGMLRPGGQLNQRMDAPGDFSYRCTTHADEAGRIRVEGAAVASFVINEGVAGSWYDPATTGQGVLLEASGELGVLALAWFTFDAEGNARDWFTAAGPISGDSALLSIQRSSNGRFNDPASPVETLEVGAGVIRFIDCSRAEFEFDIEDTGQVGSIALQRVLPPLAACLDANAAR